MYDQQKISKLATGQEGLDMCHNSVAQHPVWNCTKHPAAKAPVLRRVLSDGGPATIVCQAWM